MSSGDYDKEPFDIDDIEWIPSNEYECSDKNKSSKKGVYDTKVNNFFPIANNHELEEQQALGSEQELQPLPLTNLERPNNRFAASPLVFNELPPAPARARAPASLPPPAPLSEPARAQTPTAIQKQNLINLKQELDKLNERKRLYEDGRKREENKLQYMKSMNVDASSPQFIHDNETDLKGRISYYNEQLKKTAVRIKNKQEEIDIWPALKKRARSYTSEQMTRRNEQKKRSRAKQTEITKEKNKQTAKKNKTKCQAKKRRDSFPKNHLFPKNHTKTGGKYSRKKTRKSKRSKRNTRKKNK
jgi:hypothetical protein